MDIFDKKQKEFFELADNLYIDCINNYSDLLDFKSEMDSKSFENQMRFVCSQMGLACEYYLKGLIFPHLRIHIPPEKESYRHIIESLDENDIYKILIGDDEILRILSHTYGIQLKELKFLQQNSIKRSGHNLINLIEKLFMDEDLGISEEEQKQLFNEIKMNYWEFFGLKEGFEVNASSGDIMNIIDLSNISDAFVKGRYGHLDGYNLDHLVLIKLMHGIRGCCERSLGAFSIVNGNGPSGTMRATDITMIYPDQNSKVYVIGENGTVERVYRYTNYSQVLEQLHVMAFEKVALATGYYKYFPEQSSEEFKDLLNRSKKLQIENNSFAHQEMNYYNLTLVPDYGIEEMKRIFANHDILDGKYYTPTDLVAYNKRLYIDKNKKQTIVLSENGTFVSYSQYPDNRIRKNSNEITIENIKIINQFEHEHHSKEEIMEEFIDLDEERKRQVQSITWYLNHSINFDEAMLSTASVPEFISYLRKTRQLKKERKKLLREYNKRKSNVKEGIKR